MSDKKLLEIYRMNSGDTTYGGIPSSQKLRFNSINDQTTGITRDDFDIPDALSWLVNYNVELNRSDTDNPAPYQEETRKPDTGFRGMRYELNTIFNPNSSGVYAGLVLLASWYKETSDVRGEFRNGRFGIINEWAPMFNLHPNNSSGLKLVKVRLEDQISHNIKRVNIVLEQSGTSSRIGTSSTIARPGT